MYRKLLGCCFPNLPLVMEAAEKDGENLVIEKFIEADTQVPNITGFAAPEQYGLSQSDVRTV